jgi:hypothetical protein
VQTLDVDGIDTFINQVVVSTYAANTEVVATAAARLTGPGTAKNELPDKPMKAFGPVKDAPAADDRKVEQPRSAPRAVEATAGDMSSGDIKAIEAANQKLLDEMKSEYQALPDSQVKKDRMADIASIEKGMGTADDDRHLLWIAKPEHPRDMIPAAICVGDPFKADHVSVTVPGVGSTTRDSLAAMTDEAYALRTEAQRIATYEDMNTTVATVAYTGYQPPLNVDSFVTDNLAQQSAPGLSSFIQKLDAAGKPGNTMALYGHSYGSLVSGIALKDGASKVVDNAVLYGTPGFQASSPAQLGLRDDQFFVMNTPDDFVGRTVAATAPVHGWGSDPNEILGDRYRFTHLETQAGTAVIGQNHDVTLQLTGASGHSEYARNALERMTGFNLATVLLDRPDLAIKAAPPALMAPVPNTWGR